MQEITLAPLAREDLAAVDCGCAPLRTGARRAARTTGAREDRRQSIFRHSVPSALAEEGLLIFDHERRSWSWDLDRIHAKGYTDNVVDLMVGKLTRLTAERSRRSRQLPASETPPKSRRCPLVCGTAEEQSTRLCWEAVRAELGGAAESSYHFIHDRVQEAAYSLIPEACRAEAHLAIGRLLAAHTPPEKREEAIFEIVNQLNRGVALDHFARGTRATGRAEPDRGQTRESLDCVRIGAHVSYHWCGTISG